MEIMSTKARSIKEQICKLEFVKSKMCLKDTVKRMKKTSHRLGKYLQIMYQIKDCIPNIQRTLKNSNNNDKTNNPIEK